MDKSIGKMVLLNLPNTKRPQYRWIVRKREDGRYIVRVPKVGVLLRNLHLKRDYDYRKESLLPNGSKLWKKTKTLKVKKKFKNKTKKNL